jgi:hypothetical protein
MRDDNTPRSFVGKWLATYLTADCGVVSKRVVATMVIVPVSADGFRMTGVTLKSHSSKTLNLGK